MPADDELLDVIVSHVISVLGSLATLYHSQHMFRRDGSIHSPIAAGAGVALVLSLVAAIVISALALILAGHVLLEQHGPGREGEHGAPGRGPAPARGQGLTAFVGAERPSIRFRCIL
jgi:hypothetical protein